MTSGRTVVAIVENDAALLTALGRLLRACGYDPALFGSAEQYLARRPDGAVACLILDIDLDGISGLELQRRLLAQGAAPPVIFITGQADPGGRERDRAPGCLAYLRKPFASGDLLAALQAVERLHPRPRGP